MRLTRTRWQTKFDRVLVAPEAFGQVPADMVGTPQVEAPMSYDTVFLCLPIGDCLQYL